ncbi:hypothetical protein V2G26_018496 [Clonostachys chloroleuca]
MGRRSKQKSCFACAKDRRRCDRTIPSCARCIDREVMCAYPLAVQHRSSRSALSSHNVLDAGPSNDADSRFSLSTEPHDQIGTDVPAETTHHNLPAAASTTLPNPPPPLSKDLRWFTHPSTWVIAYHHDMPRSFPSPESFSNFIRGLQSWLTRFQRKGHNPFIHRQLYPARAIPDCIQDAYSAIAVSQGGSPENENMVDGITSSYVSKLLSSQLALTGQPLHVVTTQDHLARTQALLIYFLLALASSSISRQSQGENFVSTLHRWKMDLWVSANQDANLAQFFPCTLMTSSEESQAESDRISHLHQAFITCESIRRTWLLCSIAIGVYRSLKGDWTTSCGGDISFTARAGLWDAPSSAHWATVARKADPLFGYSLKSEALANRSVQASEVDEFAHHLFTLMWGADRVENWFIRMPADI